MIITNDELKKFLDTVWDDNNEIINFVNNLPFTHFLLASSALYTILYNSLSTEEKKLYPIFPNPINLVNLIKLKRKLFQDLSKEIKQFLENYYGYPTDYQIQNKLFLQLKKEISSIKMSPVFRDDNGPFSNQASQPNIDSMTLRQYLFYSLSFFINNENKIYFCSHCKLIINNPSEHQKAATEKGGACLHNECRSEYRKAKRRKS